MRFALVCLAALGCRGAPAHDDAAALVAVVNPPEDLTPHCVRDPQKLAIAANDAEVLGDRLIDVHYESSRHLIRLATEAGVVLGEQVLPDSPGVGRFRALGLEDGLVIPFLFNYPTPKQDIYGLARFDRDGRSLGFAMISRALFSDRNVQWHGVLGDVLLAVETRGEKPARIHWIGIDGKPVGASLDAPDPDIDRLARIGTTRAFAVVLRDHHTGSQQLAVLDFDRHTWVGAPIAPGIGGLGPIVPHGDAALVVRGRFLDLETARLTADAKLGPWRRSLDRPANANGLEMLDAFATTDGTRAFAELTYEDDAQGPGFITRFGAIAPDGRVAFDPPLLHQEQPGRELATHGTIYRGLAHGELIRFRCRD